MLVDVDNVSSAFGQVACVAVYVHLSPHPLTPCGILQTLHSPPNPAQLWECVCTVAIRRYHSCKKRPGNKTRKNVHPCLA